MYVCSRRRLLGYDAVISFVRVSRPCSLEFLDGGSTRGPCLWIDRADDNNDVSGEGGIVSKLWCRKRAGNKRDPDHHMDWTSSIIMVGIITQGNTFSRNLLHATIMRLLQSYSIINHPRMILIDLVDGKPFTCHSSTQVLEIVKI